MKIAQDNGASNRTTPERYLEELLDINPNITPADIDAQIVFAKTSDEKALLIEACDILLGQKFSAVVNYQNSKR